MRAWSCERMLSKAGDEYRLVLSDLRIPIQMQRWYRNSPEQVRLDLPDPRFQASMNAQINHLMMSLIGRETRPGDPILFYRAWQRQGSYITAALARAGDPHVSRVLSQYLATHDFGGGRGRKPMRRAWPSGRSQHLPPISPTMTMISGCGPISFARGSASRTC